MSTPATPRRTSGSLNCVALLRIRIGFVVAARISPMIAARLVASVGSPLPEIVTTSTAAQSTPRRSSRTQAAGMNSLRSAVTR